MLARGRTAALIHSPIGAAHALLPLRADHRPLLDLSQAAPAFAPSKGVIERVAAAATEPATSRYAPQPGLPALRGAFARDLAADYHAQVAADDIVITAGCNQAFCLVASALTSPGDSMVLVVPYYFNHDMWLRVEGVDVRYLMTGEDGRPDPSDLAGLCDASTRALVMVTPGNPTGVTLPPDLIGALAAEARHLGLVTVIDETYRTHRGASGPAHGLLAQPDWRTHVVSLHSFSKDLAIPGYRVGAIVAGPEVLVETLKLLDCVAISAPRIGQEAALAGLEDPSDWRRAQVARISALQETFDKIMAPAPGGFDLVTSGAYFGWVRHPFAGEAAESVVRRLVLDHDVLVIPGTAFMPGDARMLRFSFANLDDEALHELPRRLEETRR